MKKSNIIWIIIVILIISAIIIAKFFWPGQSSLPGQGQRAGTQTSAKGQAVQQNVNANINTQAAIKVSSLMFDNNQQTLAAGSEFSLQAMIDPKGKKVSASQLDVTFDPKMLKLESVTPSDTFSLILADAKIDNDKGTASITLGIPLGNAAADGVSTIAAFKFQALSSKGQTKVSFTDQSGAAADGETTNVVASLVPATIIIN